MLTSLIVGVALAALPMQETSLRTTSEKLVLAETLTPEAVTFHSFNQVFAHHNGQDLVVVCGVASVEHDGDNKQLYIGKFVKLPTGLHSDGIGFGDITVVADIIDKATAEPDNKEAQTLAACVAEL